MLDDEAARDPRAMAEAIAALPTQAPPSCAGVEGLLAGLARIDELFEDWIASPESPVVLEAGHG